MNKQIKINLVVWISSIVVFLISLYIGGVQNGTFDQNPSTIKNIALILVLATIPIGILSFIFLTNGLLKLGTQKDDVKKKNIFKRLGKFIITAPFYPFYVFFTLIKSFIHKKPKIKDLRWLVLTINIFIIAPVWLLGYVVTYYVATDELFLGTRYQVGNLAESDSMLPSFVGGNIDKYFPYQNIKYKLNRNWAYQFQRGDVVTFSNLTTKELLLKQNVNAYKNFIKRIIALPGDTVELKGGAVFVNNQPILEPYTLEPNSTFALDDYYQVIKKLEINGLFLEECQKVVVPSNNLFVLGDNRKNSVDSRVFGFVGFDDVNGYLPLEDQKKPFKEGVNIINYSEKWRDASNDYSDLTKSKKDLCPTSKEISTIQISKTNTQTKQPLPVLSGSNIFNIVNQYRSSKGLPFLSVSDELCSIAEKRADLMMANNMEAFKKSSTGNHYQFGNVQYSGEGIGENVAANFAKDNDAVEQWKTSPGHNELMLLTEKDGAKITKGCVATRVSEVGSIVVLLVGDK